MSLSNYQPGINNSCSWNYSLSQNCNTNGCGTCPDAVIKRHDTRPAFKVQVQECESTIDWTDSQLVLEANIWYKAKLKAAVVEDATAFALADNVGFDQMLVDDIIVMGGPRSPEMMLVTGFDESARTVTVQRAYHGTVARAWKKGTAMKVFRALNAPAVIENVYEDVVQEDGSTLEDQLTGTYLVYEWSATDTCLPGCFLLEYKLLRMAEETAGTTEFVRSPSRIEVPSEVALEYGCSNGLGVEWVRRFPSDREGFLVQVLDSPTAEM